mmetsp:Transcript_20029/g.29278  ORF Transcript_20029/g.29278 Transcript_20029/m.29278 type:complete len:107 (+) Transcript_20029:1358-1678(+)
MLEKGDIVEAYFEDDDGVVWYKGKIDQIDQRKGTCHILFDDGDDEVKPITELRHFEPYTSGDLVQDLIESSTRGTITYIYGNGMVAVELENGDSAPVHILDITRVA